MSDETTAEAEVPKFYWDQWPEGMLTEKQLRAKRLKPGPLAALIHYAKAADGSGFLKVYREAEATSNPISPSKLAAIEKAKATRRRKRTCMECGLYVAVNDHWDWLTTDQRCRCCGIREWAREFADQEFVVLDCETTGIWGAEILQISIIDQTGAVLLSTYLKPSVPIVEEEYERSDPDEDGWRGPRRTAFAVNGITNAMVADAPAFAEMVDRIREVLTGKLVLAFNAEFDSRQLVEACERVGVPGIDANWKCVQRAMSEYYGDYSRRYHDFKYVSLDRACAVMGVSLVNAHDALADVQATLALVRALAQPAPRKEEKIDD